jgi:hypothetical protein
MRNRRENPPNLIAVLTQSNRIGEIDLAPQMKSPGRTGARPGLSLGSLSTSLSQPIRPGVVNVTTALIRTITAPR